MATADPLDQAELAALAESVEHTAQHEENLVKATARPHGVLVELQVEPGLHDLGAATAAAEILAVVQSAQARADADFRERAQSRIASALENLAGGRG